VGAALLLCDLGNSRLKLALATGTPGPTVQRVLALDVGPGLIERLGALGDEWRAEAGALSSVADPAALRAVESALAPRCARGLSVNPPPTLRVATREPERTGRDRVYGACAAWSRFGTDCLTIDAGTALTVNLVRVRDGRPEFAGGAIGAGAPLLARALAAGGAQLFEVAPRAGAPALGTDTQSALEAGLVHGLRGAARELVERIEAEHGRGRLPIALTGGARALLARPPFLPAHRIEEVETLVLEGLALSLPGAR